MKREESEERESRKQREGTIRLLLGKATTSLRKCSISIEAGFVLSCNCINMISYI
jgi:hypothetical protein